MTLYIAIYSHRTAPNVVIPLDPLVYTGTYSNVQRYTHDVYIIFMCICIGGQCQRFEIEEPPSASFGAPNSTTQKETEVHEFMLSVIIVALLFVLLDHDQLYSVYTSMYAHIHHRHTMSYTHAL